MSGADVGFGMAGSSARMDPLPVEEAGALGVSAGVPKSLAELAIFRTLLHQPSLAKAVCDLLLTLLRGDFLDARLRELMIMRMGWATGSEYEWGQHWGIAQQFGVEAGRLVALREWRDDPEFTPAERAVLAVVDDVVANGVIGESSLAECSRSVSDDPAVLLEVVGVAGAWHMISMLLRSLQVPLDDGVEMWPPDGYGPPDT